jgi:hypothetical protein
MSLPRLWLFLAVALPVLASLAATMSTVDLTYHLRAGREILETGTIPTTDTWTFTVAGRAWFDQQWGAQVLLRAAEAIGSWTGLMVLRAAATGLIFGCLLLVARRRGLDARTAALLVLAAFAVAAPAMALRPQLFGMACFAVVLVLVDARRERPRGLWLVPIVVAIWANLHGSFFLGPLALGLAWLADVHDRVPRPHRALLVGLLAAAAASITPFGPLVWAYAAGLSANPEVTARITEWQPTSLREPAGLLFFGSVAAVGVLVARGGRRIDWPTLAWLGAFFVIGAYAERGVAWWPLAAVPVVAALLPARPDPVRADRPTFRRINAGLAATVVVVMVALLPAWRPLDPGTRTPQGLLTDAPSGVTAALRDLVRPGDRILNPQAWGSWFEYAIPDATVAVDSRIELFPADVWRAYERAVLSDRGVINRLGITIVVLDAASPARDVLMSDGWVVRYESGGIAILVPA